jgi:hypothetical protein
MKRWHTLSAGIILALLTLGLCSRGAPYSVESSCSLEDVLLGQKTLPGAWQSELGAVYLPTQDKLGARRAYHIFLERDDLTAQQTIYEYASPLRARFHFWFDREVFFPSSWAWEMLENPPAVDADRYRILCGDSEDEYLGQRCGALMQYGPYLSDFSTSIDDQTMQVEDFKQLVTTIDERFKRCEQQEP